MFSAIYASPENFTKNVKDVTFVPRKTKSDDFVQRSDVKALDDQGGVHTLYIHPYYDASDRTGGMFTMGVTNSRGKFKSDTKRLTLPIIIDTNKKEEVEFAQLLHDLAFTLSKTTGKKIKSPVSEYKKDGITKKSIWCNIIGSGSGNLYTIAYDASKNNLKVQDLTMFMYVRPAVSLTIVTKKDGGMSMKCNLTEFCVIDIVDRRSQGFLAPSS